MTACASQYDPYSHAAMSDPHELYRALRAEGAPHFLPKYNAWAFTLFDDVKAASLKEKCLDFSHGQTPGQLLLNEFIPHTFATMNGPAHKAWRGIIAGDFTPDAVAAQVPRYRALARELWEPLRKQGRMDAYRDLANRFFCINAGYKLGLPRDDSEHMRSLIDDMLHRNPNQVGGNSERNQSAGGALMAYLHEFVGRLRADPARAEGFTKAYLEAEIDGHRLTDEELVWYLFSLLVLGSETTPMVIAATFYHLGQNPAQKAAVLSDNGLLRRAFFEAARYRQPTNMLARRAREDFEVGGQAIRAGQNLLFIYASANRDAKRFSDPDQFNCLREDGDPNMTFGIGSHFCLGKFVAIEAGIAILEEVFRDITDFEVNYDRCENSYGEHLSGFVSVPLSFTLKA